MLKLFCLLYAKNSYRMCYQRSGPIIHGLSIINCLFKSKFYHHPIPLSNKLKGLLLKYTDTLISEKLHKKQSRERFFLTILVVEPWWYNRKGAIWMRQRWFEGNWQLAMSITSLTSSRVPMSSSSFLNSVNVCLASGSFCQHLIIIW